VAPVIDARAPGRCGTRPTSTKFARRYSRLVGCRRAAPDYAPEVVAYNGSDVRGVKRAQHIVDVACRHPDTRHARLSGRTRGRRGAAEIVLGFSSRRTHELFAGWAAKAARSRGEGGVAGTGGVRRGRH